MELRRYLFEKRMSQTAFAEHVGYSRQYVMSIIHGRFYPGKKFIKAVEKATKGEVKKEDYYKKEKKNE